MVPFRCKDCKWFDKQHASLGTHEIPDNLGYCRKHKPMVFQMANRFYGGWPLVDLHDLCGEFRQDEEIA